MKAVRSLLLPAALIAATLTVTDAATLGEPPSTWTDGYVIGNGIRIHYWRTGGAGKPVMLLAHGSSDDGLCWTNFAKEFQASYDIVMVDARGHGLSDPPRSTDAPDAQAEDIAAVIRELKLEKPVVMGHSMGSSAAAWFGATHSDMAKAIILEDPNLGSRTRPPLDDAAREKARQGILARNNTTVEELVSLCEKNTPQWGRSECEYWAPSKRRHHPDTVLGNAGRRPAMRELFPKITVPVLIVKADAKDDVRRENEDAAKLLPNGKIVHVDGAGHNVRRDRKDQTVAIVKEFLQKN